MALLQTQCSYGCKPSPRRGRPHPTLRSSDTATPAPILPSRLLAASWARAPPTNPHETTSTTYEVFVYMYHEA